MRIQVQYNEEGKSFTVYDTKKGEEGELSLDYDVCRVIAESFIHQAILGTVKKLFPGMSDEDNEDFANYVRAEMLDYKPGYIMEIELESLYDQWEEEREEEN